MRLVVRTARLKCFRKESESRPHEMQSQCENRKLKAVESDFENVCVTSELLLVRLGVVQT